VFDWELTETFGLTLGLSSDPPANALLRFVAGRDDGCS